MRFEGFDQDSIVSPPDGDITQRGRDPRAGAEREVLD